MKFNVQSSPSLDMPITRRQNRINMIQHYQRIWDCYPEDMSYLTYNAYDIAQTLDLEEERSPMERFTHVVKRNCSITAQKIGIQYPKHFNVMFCILCPLYFTVCCVSCYINVGISDHGFLLSLLSVVYFNL